MVRGSILIVFLVASGVSCATQEVFTPGPPEGWTGERGKWWVAGYDTAGAFRDLTSLEAMGIGRDMTFAGSAAIARGSDLAVRQLSHAVKRSLLPIVRNEPEVVDSLFRRFVEPKLREADLRGDPGDLVTRYKSQAYRILSRHFREPRTIVQLGADVPVAYPDSLRSTGVAGRVELQVRVNQAGEPAAIWLLEGVHPVLDDIAMKATTQVRWQPAYLLRVGKSDPVPSWVRFTVNFQVG